MELRAETGHVAQDKWSVCSSESLAGLTDGKACATAGSEVAAEQQPEGPF